MDIPNIHLNTIYDILLMHNILQNFLGKENQIFNFRSIKYKNSKKNGMLTLQKNQTRCILREI